MWVPTERSMGIVQRVFYWHVSVAWVSFLAFFIVFVASILYLVKKASSWDHLAYSAAHVGVLLNAIVLVSGSIWARPIWGTWWVWEPRLTTALVLFLIYTGYIMVRSYSAESQAPRYAAVVGIIGFADVPIVYFSIRWWRTIHPGPVVAGGQGSGLDPRMLLTLIISVVAFSLLLWLLLRVMVALKKSEDEIKQMQRELQS
ncbi:MAG: cytochrome c biogenesis protein CcsA [Chloroflexi bacterium]|nr:cytochrome c biogenesis protein CcsA [Chloroflexota bacterium]